MGRCKSKKQKKRKRKKNYNGCFFNDGIKLLQMIEKKDKKLYGNSSRSRYKKMDQLGINR